MMGVESVNMKRTALTYIVLLFAALLLILSGCAGAPAAQQMPAAAEPSASPTPAPTEESLPDVDITSWEFIVANMYTYVGRYNPTCGLFCSQLLDVRIIDQAKAMMADAEAAGFKLYNNASFRNFDYFEYHYNDKCSELGSAVEAVKVCFPGGCSDHNTALAIDFTDDPQYNFNYDHEQDPDFQDTEAYQWLLDNCQNYGFVQRYIEGKEEYYGLACCPGHFRYVGVEAATYMKEHNLCLEEFVALYQ